MNDEVRGELIAGLMAKVSTSDLAHWAQCSYEAALPDDPTLYDQGKAWVSVGEGLHAILAEQLTEVAALSKPPAEMREAIARIIEPRAYCAEWLEVNQYGVEATEGWRSAILKQADAILSLVSTREGEGWRPIETAPRDGTDVLVYGDVQDTSETFPEWRPSRDAGIARWNGDNWQGENSVAHDEYWLWQPKGWQPLPPPPSPPASPSDQDGEGGAGS